MALNSSEIIRLKESVIGHLDSAQNDYSTVIRRWEKAIVAFSGAFLQAHLCYKSALDESAKLKKIVFDVSFAALTIVCGEAFGWIKAALMNRSDLYEKFCRHAFGTGIEKWSSNLLKDAIQKRALSKITYKMPDHLNRVNPALLEIELKNLFLENTQHVLENIKTMKDLIDTYEGSELLNEATKRLSWEEAANKVRWEFNVKFRQNVLGSCYYFSHTPEFPIREEMARNIERCMWSETFKGNNPVPPKLLQYPKGTVPVATPLSGLIEAIRFLLYKPGSPVENRLITLGIMAPASRQKIGSKQTYALKNFGAYTDDHELKQLLRWAYEYKPIAIGGQFDPARAIPQGLMSAYRAWQLRAVG